MVHPSVLGRSDRERQRRFIGVMLAAPFFAAGAAVTLVTSGMGAAVTMAAIFAAFGLCWFVALLVAATGKMAAAGPIALAMAAIALGGLIGAAGGLSSPVAMLALALPFEAWWIGASRRAALWGGASAAIAIAIQSLSAAFLPFVDAHIAAWHWLVPLAWALTLIPRISAFRGTAGAADTVDAGDRLEDIIDAVVLRIARHGEVVDASAKARTLLKLPPELLSGTGLFDRVHLSDRVAYLSALADMRDGALSRRLELRIRLPQSGNGTQNGNGFVADNYQPFALELVRGEEQSDVFTLVLRENDETARLREELAQANETAAAAEVAKGRFLAVVSHELRTPLNAIIGFSDMLLHEMFGAFKDPRQKEYVGLVRDSGQHLLAVVTSILDVSRIESGVYATEPEPFRFVEAVDMCQSMMRLQAQAKNIDLRTQIAPDAGDINADRRAVQQMLINLVSNAIKFTPDGGDVVVGAKRIGSRLHFWVRDTGIGIAEEDFANLGKPFMQIQNDYTRRFEGTGLGLSLVKGLVALHEGTMSIESMPGEGTTVTISLPVSGPKGRPANQTGVLTMPVTRAKGDGNGSLRKTA
ncbi:PAS domain-containing sensor histidine kinase [Mesorhizobium sp. M00.F.Ca.ET.151.01.1.1]|uniref:sensor histidine kinase n=1 Tax=unclassified Mesorhizobium TaxID=325217 RepID=UPI000FCA649B|nr:MULTISPECIES: HAMP domain-containing sensor histidine kinase [unclassified Mesorhizobium]TGR58842.1 PAS domain-containing sensor histidine kinase [bacterium M00.F.Ca.ET.199.01.1.1]TGU41047.1 PAS domain-containing sensor histidine kinase [bacterium M00.F.Ca.ET.156.01.1.1]TGU92043.1 PAS domain-containing sensor histidine kinase [Mesorhizobium sp. M00.F.Ca.ET.151.01.1.1]TGV53540.1 PAS domain-containing sensor histidine kinase [bacterium M00.F.Ca.ET.141.01.1.1]TGV90712.1 PAS domain-containing s